MHKADVNYSYKNYNKYNNKIKKYEPYYLLNEYYNIIVYKYNIFDQHIDHNIHLELLDIVMHYRVNIILVN